MNNYEAIKRMSLDEMAAVFYLFARPMLDGLAADAPQRQEIQESIRAFLSAEVKSCEGTG